MRKLVFGESFLKSVKNLDNQLKPKLKFYLDILQENPFDSKLHTKLLKGKLSGFCSFRLSRDYRVIFQIKSDEVLLVEIGHRKDVYQ